MDWSSEQYLLFEDERSRPAADLIARLKGISVRSVVDLGCGPGNSTELLLQAFPGAQIIGLDHSPDMIARAKNRLPGIEFRLADIADWEEKERVDLVFSNAALQWVPAHELLFPFLLEKIKPGGVLAVQMPDNSEEPAHRLIRELALDPRWENALRGAERLHRPGAAWYFDLLKDRVSGLDIWRTTYYHVLRGGPDAVVEWLKGTGLRPVLSRLDEAGQKEFLSRYRQRIAEAYPPDAQDRVWFPFPRLFLVATK